MGSVQSDPTRRRGIGRRIGVSVPSFGSMIAVMLRLFFFVASFSVYQNIALVVVVLLVFIAVMGAT